jgi:alkylhydroperoxidase family enzyme
MARIELPPGDGPEIMRVWGLRPRMGKAVAELSAAVYEGSELPARVREAVRMRIAQINQCHI